MEKPRMCLEARKYAEYYLTLHKISIFKYNLLNLDLLIALNWICVYYLEQTFRRVEELKKEGKSVFDTRNDSQVFAANNLAIAYGNVSF